MPMAEQAEVEFEEEDEEVTGNTIPNRKRGAHLEPYHWKPGQSGNLNGRPKRKPLTDAYRELLESIDPKDKKGRTIARQIAEALAREVIKKGSVAAAVELADRVEGKVAQRQEHTGAEGGPMQFESLGNRQEVEAKIAVLLMAAEERKRETVANPEPKIIEAAVPKPLPLNQIPMEPVERSTNVAATGYDPAGRVLLVRYKSGETYLWRKIPEAEYRALRQAESAGQYMKGIEQRYGAGAKVDRGELEPPKAALDLAW